VRRLALALGLVLWTGVVHAQTMRPFATFRQTHGETRLAVRLEYAAGNLRVTPGRAAELYRMDLSYDEDRYVPVSDFDAQSGSVVLGLRPHGDGGVRVVSRNQLSQVAGVSLSPSVDLALDLTLGAVDADVELGGLRVNSLGVKTGASRTVLRFSRPNATRCRRADISAGAAEVSVLGLGNSRCDEIEFDGGMGKVMLDFSGTWSSSAQVEVKMAMGELTLRLPRRVGVRISMDKFLSSFEPAGLVRRGDAYQSPNYDRAQRHLDLDLTTAVGGVNVEWVD
jgi:cell wall-active antibiotic response 4TMS protein YvqF